MNFLAKFIFILLLPPCLWGQNGFEKVYLFGDTTTIFSNTFPTDSCIYYMSSTGNNTNRLFLNFGKLDLEGNVLQSYFFTDTTSLQYSGYQLSCDDALNFRGNFVFSYATLGTFGQAPRLVEISPNGTKILDTTYAHIWIQDSLNCSAYNNLALLDDSSYLLAYNYGDYTTDSNTGLFDGMIGVVIYKITYDGIILWSKKFQFPIIGSGKPPQRNLFVRTYSDNSFLLGMREEIITGQFDTDDYSKNYFIYCDSNGNETDRDTFQDTQYCYGTPGYHELADGTSIFGYQDSYTFGLPPNNDETNVRPVIAKLDADHQLIWKKPMSEEYYSSVGESTNFNDFVVKPDGIIAATMYFKLIEIPKQLALLQIHKLSLDGEKLWKREYAYFIGDSINDGEYFIKDIDSTSDGGYLFAGHVSKWDDFQGNKPYQYGYLLKTNCLGFLAVPQAAVSVVSSSLDSVVFANQSIQAGSYTWQFGDGQSVTTSEYVDTVAHIYTQPGTYTITLIAHGCNNENDTLTFEHTIADTAQSYHGDGTLLTVYPNPVINGDNLGVYIGAITAPVELTLVDELGRVVFQQIITIGNTTYFLPTNKLAAASYRVQVFQDKKMMESEQVIVY